jgi:hypothetical protein
MDKPFNCLILKVIVFQPYPQLLKKAVLTGTIYEIGGLPDLKLRNFFYNPFNYTSVNGNNLKINHNELMNRRTYIWHLVGQLIRYFVVHYIH